MFNLGMGEITVILLLALIFLGPSKLPDLAAGLGKIIKEIRKATSDVKNEIALDDTFRKPFEELRDAVTLHPDELKRRDQWRKEAEEAAKRAAEEMARAEAENAAGVQGPPDGLVPPGTTDSLAPSNPVPLFEGVPAGPNDTIIQTAPHHATLDDIPTPPPEVPLSAMPPPAVPPPAKPAGVSARIAPAGTVARPGGVRPGKLFGDPAVPPTSVSATPHAAPPLSGGENAANVTQILKEEDLLPSFSSGKPPPPPPLPGLRPAVPRPSIISPQPPAPAAKKKP